jgi:hypothetical protein
MIKINENSSGYKKKYFYFNRIEMNQLILKIYYNKYK